MARKKDGLAVHDQDLLAKIIAFSKEFAEHPADLDEVKKALVRKFDEDEDEDLEDDLGSLSAFLAIVIGSDPDDLDDDEDDDDMEDEDEDDSDD